MKFKHLPLALALFAGVSISAHAELFDFSFTVESGQAAAIAIAGSFDGTRNGNLITKLSNITVLANGVAFQGNGSLYSAEFKSSNWGPGGVVSVDGTQNNFIFSNSDFAAGDTNYINVVSSLNPSVYGKQNAVLSTGAFANDFEKIPTNWKVTAAVPEPETYALLLAGLGLISAVVKRRKQKQS